MTVFFAAPGGLFELTLGLYLLRRGFGYRGPRTQIVRTGSDAEVTPDTPLSDRLDLQECHREESNL